MEIEGDEEHDELNAELLKEVSLPLTVAPEPISFVPVSGLPFMPIPQSTINPEGNQPSFSFSPAEDADIQARFAGLRAVPQTMPESSVGFSFEQNSFGQEKGSPKLFNMGSVPSTYPGLDGHPRRITPIPMSRAQSSGTSQSTIGNTTILTRDAENIKKEVRDAVKQMFPGIKIGEKGRAEFQYREFPCIGN